MPRKFILFISLFLFLIIPGKTFAHIYHEQGPIAAQIHISPDDSPIANEQSYIHIQLNDVSGNFSIEKCNCSVKVFKEDQEIFSLPFSEIVDVTFPEKGIYNIEIAGNPIHGSSFESFKFTYEARVESRIPTSNSIGHMPLYLCICVILLVLIIFVAYKYVKKRS